MNPWLVFALTCLGMAGVTAFIGLTWTEGFAQLIRWQLRLAARQAAPRTGG